VRGGGEARQGTSDDDPEDHLPVGRKRTLREAQADFPVPTHLQTHAKEPSDSYGHLHRKGDELPAQLPSKDRHDQHAEGLAAQLGLVRCSEADRD